MRVIDPASGSPSVDYTIPDAVDIRMGLWGLFRASCDKDLAPIIDDPELTRAFGERL